MTWIKFVFFLCGIYAAYYTAIICWDIFRNRKMSKPEDSHELTFTEHLEPVKPGLEYLTDYPPSAMVASGGVSLKKLFSLSREDAVEYTRGVSF